MFSLVKEHKTVALAYLGGGLILLCIYGFMNAFGTLEGAVDVLKYGIVIFFLANIALSCFKLRLPLYHPYVMFLGTLFLFILSRLFFDILGGNDFALTYMFSDYTYSFDIQVKLLLGLFLTVWGLQLGAFLGGGYSGKTIINSTNDISWTSVGIVLFYLGAPFLVYQYFMAGAEVLEHGYGIKLASTIKYTNSYLVTIMSRLALCGFIVYLSGFPKSKWRYLHLGIFVLVYSLQLMQGMRSALMGMLLTLFFYVFSTKMIVFRKHFVFVFVLLLFLLGAFVERVRSSDQVSSDSHWASEFLHNQGVSMQVLGYAIEYEDEVDYSVKNMFAHAHYRYHVIQGRLQNKPVKYKKEEIMKRYNTLSFQLTYKVNPTALKSGWDMASSYLAELYLLGGFWLLLFANLIIGFITVFVPTHLIKNKVGTVFLLFFLPSWFLIARDNLFDFITDNMTNVLFVVVILLLIRIMKKYPSISLKRFE